MNHGARIVVACVVTGALLGLVRQAWNSGPVTVPADYLRAALAGAAVGLVASIVVAGLAGA